MNSIARNYLIMFLLLGVSGMPFISGNDLFIIGIAGLLLLFTVVDKDISVDRDFVIIISTMMVLVVFQAFIFSFFKMVTVIGLVLKLLIAYLSVKLLKEQFINYFINMMIFLTLFSFLLFIPIFFIPGLEEVIMSKIPSPLSYTYFQMGIGHISKPTLILFEFNTTMDSDFGQLVRNCGPFWEPGAFGGYLILALIFNSIREQQFSNRINWLFIIAMISTQSTTTFIALFVFILIVYLIFQRYPISLKIIIVSVLFLGCLMAFQKIYFLKSKIQNEIASLDEDIATGGDSRLASAVLDLRDVMRYPFTGRGMWKETRIDKIGDIVMRNNGVTNLMARWGIFFFIIYFYWYYKGFKEYCRIYDANKYMPLAILSMIWLIGISQDYFESPFFMSLAFLYTPYRYTDLYVVETV